MACPGFAALPLFLPPAFVSALSLMLRLVAPLPLIAFPRAPHSPKLKWPWQLLLPPWNVSYVVETDISKPLRAGGQMAGCSRLVGLGVGGVWCWALASVGLSGAADGEPRSGQLGLVGREEQGLGKVCRKVLDSTTQERNCCVLARIAVPAAVVPLLGVLGLRDGCLGVPDFPFRVRAPRFVLQ